MIITNIAADAREALCPVQHINKDTNFKNT